MISARLVQIIENHSDQITSRVVSSIRQNGRLQHLSQLPDSELRSRCHDILHHLGHWLVEAKESEVAEFFQPIGRERAREAIPLSEVVRGVQMLKRATLEYARDQGIDLNSLDIYAEEEWEHSVSMFFDSVIYHYVLGYEQEAVKSLAVAVR